MDRKNTEKQALGCILEPPDERDYLYEVIAGGGQELPQNFVIEAPHFYQNGIDACVGMAVASAKSVQEGKEISPRYAWHLAKKSEDYQGWGTYVTYCLKGMIEEGALEFGVIDESVVGVDRKVYMKPNITLGMKVDAKKNSAKSYWRAGYSNENIEQLKQAMFQEKMPLVASMQWYAEYNNPIKGFLPKGKLSVYGHAFVLKGWKTDSKGREYLVFQNSWKKSWGDKGDFYIYSDELLGYGLGSFYVITDIDSDKASILAKYDGQLVRNAGKAPHYYVSGGKIAWIKNEESFFFGRGAGFWGDWETTVTVDTDLEPLYDIIF